MNKLLAGMLRFLNGLLAILIIGFCISAGTLLPSVIGNVYIGKNAGLTIGFAGGLLTAVVVCGFLAVLLEIRTELIKLRTLAAEWTDRGGVAFDRRLAREPRLTGTAPGES